MKALNTIQFMSNAIESLTEYKIAIAVAETFEEAKSAARKMIGYIDCLITFTNTMICKENNEFTDDFNNLLDGWMYKMYQELINKATATNQDHDTLSTLLGKRDEYRFSVKSRQVMYPPT